MKITVIISIMLIAQVSASFFDAFQGAVLSVGKLFTDVVTDVKDTVDCTILAVERALSLKDGTAHYNDKCGHAYGTNGTVSDTHFKEGNIPTVEISISNNEEYLKKEIPAEIEVKINETLTKLFQGYNPHDELEDVERVLAKETERLTKVSEAVKQELNKLSNELHFDFKKLEPKDTKPSIDTILQELKLLEAIEQNVRNSSEANQVHQVIDDVLRKLNAIETSEALENVKVEGILKEIEDNSNSTFKDIRQRLLDWKAEEDRHLDLIKSKLEEHQKTPEHLEYVEKSNETQAIQPSEDLNDRSTTKINKTVQEDSYKPNKTTLNEDAASSPIIVTVSSTQKPATEISTVAISNLTINPTTSLVDEPSVTTSMQYLKTNTTTTTTEKVPEYASTESGPPVPRSLQAYKLPDTNNTILNSSTISTTQSTPTSVMTELNAELSSSTSDLLKTTPKILSSEPSTKPDSKVNQKTTGLSTTESSVGNNFTSRNLANDKDLSTPKIASEQSNNEQINDVSVTSTPVVNTTDSYINNNSHLGGASSSVSTESVLSTVSPSTSTLKSQTQTTTQVPDYVLNETLKTTTPFSTVVTTTTFVDKLNASTSYSVTTPNLSIQQIRTGQAVNNYDFTTGKTTTIVEDKASSTTSTLITISKILSKQTSTGLPQIDDHDFSSSKIEGLDGKLNFTTSLPIKTPQIFTEQTTAYPPQTSDRVLTTSKVEILDDIPNSATNLLVMGPQMGIDRPQKSDQDYSTTKIEIFDDNLNSTTSQPVTSPQIFTQQTTVHPPQTSDHVLTTSTIKILGDKPNFASSSPLTAPHLGIDRPQISDQDVTTAKIETLDDTLNTTTSLPLTTPIIFIQKTITDQASSNGDTTALTSTPAEAISTTTASTAVTTVTKVTEVTGHALTTVTITSTEDKLTATTSSPETTTKLLSEQTTTRSTQSSVQTSTSSATTETTRKNTLDVSSMTTEKSLPLSSHPTVPTPSLDDFLKYIDRVMSSTKPSTPVTQTTETSATHVAIPASIEVHAPQISIPSQSVHNAPPPYARNPTAPINTLQSPPRFVPPQNVAPPYIRSNPTIPVNTGIPPPTKFIPPTSYFRNNASMPVPPRLIPPPSRPIAPQRAYNRPPAYGRSMNPIAPGNRELIPSSRFMPPQTGNSQQPQPIKPLNNVNRPSDFFNRPPVNMNVPMGLSTHTPTNTPKKNNFDDKDYDSFFHMPSKDIEAHYRAVRDARKLIEDSQRAHRVINSILNKKNKGKSVFNLPKSLKLGK